MTLRREPVDLDAVAATVRATMGQLIAGKGQRLRIDVDPDARWVIGDDVKTQQVLTNYVSNAYKYSPEGAQITIRVRRNGDHAHVTVSDTGMGISAEDQKLLFTKFYRVDNSATREIGGTGLGLSIVAQIVTAQGGEVGVTSSPGKGSTFSFTVPLLAGEPPERGP
jgi:signal transduction histidine kinase